MNTSAYPAFDLPEEVAFPCTRALRYICLARPDPPRLGLGSTQACVFPANLNAGSYEHVAHDDDLHAILFESITSTRLVSL